MEILCPSCPSTSRSSAGNPARRYPRGSVECCVPVTCSFLSIAVCSVLFDTVLCSAMWRLANISSSLSLSLIFFYFPIKHIVVLFFHLCFFFYFVTQKTCLRSPLSRIGVFTLIAILSAVSNMPQPPLHFSSTKSAFSQYLLLTRS